MRLFSRMPGTLRANVAMLAIVGLGLSGCNSEPPAMPSPAPGVAEYERRPFGDTISAVDNRAWMDVLDQVEALEPGRRIRWLPRVLDVAVTPEAVRSHYAAVLEADGWSSVPLAVDFRQESWSYAWRSEAGGDVFAVVGLTPKRAAAGVVPFNILTTLPETRR